MSRAGPALPLLPKKLAKRTFIWLVDPAAAALAAALDGDDPAPAAEPDWLDSDAGPVVLPPDPPPEQELSTSKAEPANASEIEVRTGERALPVKSWAVL